MYKNLMHINLVNLTWLIGSHFIPFIKQFFLFTYRPLKGTRK